MKFELPDGYIQNNPNILQHIRNDIEEENSFHYFLVGKVGCGKTYLANIVSEQFKKVKTINCFSLYSKYLYTIQSNYDDKAEIVRKLQHSLRGEFAVLDDLGAETPRSESSRSFISSVLHDGYNWHSKMKERNKKTRSIITSNLSLDKIKDLYGVRIIDRIFDLYTIMEFENYSFRKQRKKIIKG